MYVCVSVCCIDSTTHQIMAGPPAPSHRVINNWPFVPFLPRLFLFSPPPLLLSPSSSLHSLSPFFFLFLPAALSFSCQYIIHSLFSLFLSLSLSSDSLFSYTMSATFLSFSLYFFPHQVIVETLCPTFTETAPLLAIPQWLVGVCMCDSE